MRITQIRVPFGETWGVPHGFGKNYRRVAADHYASKVRCDPLSAIAEPLEALLICIGYRATPETISTWSAYKRVEAEVYAVNVHLRASDNPLRAHPPLEWLPDPWMGGEGEFGPNPTVLLPDAA